MKKVLITGALGFIGSHFVKQTLDSRKDLIVIGFDKDDSKKSLRRLDGYLDNPNFFLVKGDLCDDISELLEGIDIVFHFAAKTFVDHSFRSPYSHVKNNILGTYNLLEQVCKFKPLYVHISSDEVYGQIPSGYFTEVAPLSPTNPYSGTKAAADMLVAAWGNSYKFPYIITRTENNYGSYQHPQKVLPVFIKKALNHEPLPVYGDGKHRRMWLRVEDHCSAIWHLINNLARGIFNIAGGQELENIELARQVLSILNKPKDLIRYIPDKTIRPFHDRRYAIDCSKIKGLGWKPKYKILSGLAETIEWFVLNEWWLK